MYGTLLVWSNLWWLIYEFGHILSRTNCLPGNFVPISDPRNLWVQIWDFLSSRTFHPNKKAKFFATFNLGIISISILTVDWFWAVIFWITHLNSIKIEILIIKHLEMTDNRVFVYDNRVKSRVRYNNYHFWEKNRDKVARSFRCSTPKCYASISLKMNENEMKEPYEISNLNENHSESCERKPGEFFETREFLQQVRKISVELFNDPFSQSLYSFRWIAIAWHGSGYWRWLNFLQYMWQARGMNIHKASHKKIECLTCSNFIYLSLLLYKLNNLI